VDYPVSHLAPRRRGGNDPHVALACTPAIRVVRNSLLMIGGDMPAPVLSRAASVQQAAWATELLMRESPRGCLWFDDVARINYDSFDVDLALGEFSRRVSTGNASQRVQAVQALAWLADRRAISPLVRALADPEWDVRLIALASLSELGSLPAWALPPVRARLEDSEAAVRTLVPGVLACVADFEAPRAVRPALEDRSANVQMEAAWALATLAARGFLDPDALDVLQILMAQEHQPYLAYAAYWALGWYPGTDEREAFRRSSWGLTVWALVTGTEASVECECG
jgi:hypothetical protein